MVNTNVSVMGSIEMSVNTGKWVGMEGIIAMIKYTRTIFLLFLIVKDKRLNSNEHSIKRTVCLQNKTRLYFVIFIKLILLSFCSIFTTENLSLKVQRIVIIETGVRYMPWLLFKEDYDNMGDISQPNLTKLVHSFFGDIIYTTRRN